MPRLANFVGFQAVWLACVLGAAHDSEWLGPLATLFWLALHLLGNRERVRELALIAAVGLVGTAVGAIELQLGWLDFAGTPIAGELPPAWIVALWLAFASTFTGSFAWAMRRPWLAILLGAIGAPLSYCAGARLGAVDFGEPIASSIAGVALTWSAAMAACARLTKRCERDHASGRRDDAQPRVSG